MYQGIAVQDSTGSATAHFGAHVHVGNASEPFALVYFGNGSANNWSIPKRDALVERGQGCPGRGYAQHARGRTWNFFFRVSQDNT